MTSWPLGSLGTSHGAGRNVPKLVFEKFGHRGQKRQPWLDVLWLKVQALRGEGLTWEAATKQALDAWDGHNVQLPPVWRRPIKRPIDNLVRQLKRRKESVADLGIDQVTTHHFWIGLVCCEFTIAARLHHAATPRLKTEIQSQLRKCWSSASANSHCYQAESFGILRLSRPYGGTQ